MSLGNQINFSKAGISQPVKDDWWKMRAHLQPQKHYNELQQMVNSDQYPPVTVEILSNVRQLPIRENYATD